MENSSLPSSLSHGDFGLHPNTRPLRKVLARPGSYCGTFASTKCLGPAVFESFLERDFHYHLCCDPRVAAYAVQAHQLTFWMPKNGAFVNHIYTPDFVVRLRDGQTLVIEVKAEYLAAQKYWTAREHYIREAYYRDYDIPLVVVSERHIRIQPRLRNYAEMFRAGSRFIDSVAEISVRDAIASEKVALTIGDILKIAQPGESTAAIYGALMQLALNGEVEFDQESLLGKQTLVKKRT